MKDLVSLICFSYWELVDGLSNSCFSKMLISHEIDDRKLLSGIVIGLQ